MGLTINAAATSATQPPDWQQRRQSFASMMSEVQSGDISAAKQTYAKITAGGAAPINSPLAQLGTALQSGDSSAIQTAAKALQSGRSGHHHHRHAGQSADSTSQPTASSTSGSTTGPSTNILV